MRTQDVDLFGEPIPDPKQSQWFTPMYLARRTAQWVPNGLTVLEPGGGRGNLVAALLEKGHQPELITIVERDVRWFNHLRARFPLCTVVHTDFHSYESKEQFDVCEENPPFEDNEHTRFILHGLDLAKRVVAIVPSDVEFSNERDVSLWIPRAIVTRMAKLPQRVKYGGHTQGNFETVVLDIAPRARPRADDDIWTVVHEVWRRTQEEERLAALELAEWAAEEAA